MINSWKGKQNNMTPIAGNYLLTKCDPWSAPKANCIMHMKLYGTLYYCHYFNKFTKKILPGDLEGEWETTTHHIRLPQYMTLSTYNTIHTMRLLCVSTVTIHSPLHAFYREIGCRVELGSGTCEGEFPKNKTRSLFFNSGCFYYSP